MEILTDKSLEKKVSFYEEVLNNIPASVHIIQLDKDFNTLPIWVNDMYEKIFGYNIEDRDQLGYAGSNELIYHPDDIISIKEHIQFLIENPTTSGAIVFRYKTLKNDYKWVYMLANMFSKNEIGYQLLCIAIDIDTRLAFNNHEINLYLKKIARLENKIKLNKLTKTEQLVITQYGKGLSTKEVASKLNRSYETINNHKRNIFKKKGFHKVTELVSFAEECGL